MALKPVYLMHDGGITRPLLSAAVDGVSELLRYARVNHQVGVRNFGIWRQPGYRMGEHLLAYQSVDWYLQEGRNHGRPGQLNADKLIDELTHEPWRQSQDH